MKEQIRDFLRGTDTEKWIDAGETDYVCSERLLAFSLSIIAARAGWANRTMSIREFESIPRIVWQFSAVSETEALESARAAVHCAHVDSLATLALEVVVLELRPEELLALIDSLSELMTVDNVLCEFEREHLVRMYLEVVRILSSEQHVFDYDVLDFITSLQELLKNWFDDAEYSKKLRRSAKRISSDKADLMRESWMEVVKAGGHAGYHERIRRIDDEAA